MGCSSCGSKGSCGSPDRGGCSKSGSCSSYKLDVFNWLNDVELPNGQKEFDCIEVRFKNSRKEFFRNVEALSLNIGDVIAVESSPGHDIGTISLTGELVKKQMSKRKVAFDSEEVKKVYRLAKKTDVEKWIESQEKEIDAMYKARTMAIALGLEMKISDVEYQGDGTKAIFYYTANARVDFRELIKKLAEEFKVRIEMRQIGARQEAGRLGGIGSCGRELCCSTWLTDFRSVSTSAARYQQLSLNPEKLAGQCGKLKCCLNYELDAYVDALKEFPNNNTKLETKEDIAFFRKMDIFRRKVWYSNKKEPLKFIELKVDRVNEIIAMNKKGEKPQNLISFVEYEEVVVEPNYENVVGQDSLTRFDKPKKSKGNKNRKRPNNKKSQGQGDRSKGKNPNQEGQPKGNKNRNNNRNKNKGKNPKNSNPNRNNSNRNKPKGNVKESAPKPKKD